MAEVDDVLSGISPWLVHRGDAIRFARDLPDESIDSFVTDPPYGIDLALQWTKQTKVVRNDGPLQARRLWTAFVPEAYRAARNDTAHIFFAAWSKSWSYDILAEHFDVKGQIVWYKRQWGLGWYLRPRFEIAYYCHKGRPPRPDKAEGNVWEHARDGRLLHPCQKPIDLLRRAVRLTCPPGGVVCDLFAGIHSTGVAAVKEQRCYLGNEIEQKYCTLGRARIVAALNEPKDAGPGGAGQRH